MLHVTWKSLCHMTSDGCFQMHSKHHTTPYWYMSMHVLMLDLRTMHCCADAHFWTTHHVCCLRIYAPLPMLITRIFYKTWSQKTVSNGLVVFVPVTRFWCLSYTTIAQQKNADKDQVPYKNTNNNNNTQYDQSFYKCSQPTKQEAAIAG